MTPEEQLAKILKQNQNIVFGKTIGTDADGNCTVQGADGSILARSGGQISAGSAIALKADDGQWYAVSARQTGTVNKKSLFKRKNKVEDVAPQTSNVVFLLKKNEQITIDNVTKTVTRLYVGGHQADPELIYEIDPLIESLAFLNANFQVGTDGIFTAVNHSFVLNAQVQISSITTSPPNTNTGIRSLGYVRNVTQNTFKLSRTLGGEAQEVLYPCSGIIGMFSRLAPSFNTSSITKTSDGFKAHFITQPIENYNALDFYVYSDGTIYKSRLTIPDSDLFHNPVISAIVSGDGSFSVRGTRSQILQGDLILPSNPAYFNYQLRIDQEITSKRQEYANSFGVDISNFTPNIYFGDTLNRPSTATIPTFFETPTTPQTLAWFNRPDGSLGVVIATTVVVLFFSTLNSSLTYLGELLLSTTLPVRFIPFRQGFSVLIRPEDNIINDIRFDNYPEIGRILPIDFLAASPNSTNNSYGEFKLLRKPSPSLPFTADSYAITEIVDRLLHLNSSQAFSIKARLDRINYDYYLWDGTEKKLDLLTIDPVTGQQKLKVALGDNFVKSNLYSFTGDAEDKSKGIVVITDLNSASDNEQDVNYFKISEDLAFSRIDIAAFV